MLTCRTAALAMTLIGVGAAPALAATCNLTVQGASVIDDAACTVMAARGVMAVAVEGGSTVRIRRRLMSASLSPDPELAGRYRRTTSFGRVVVSDRTDDKVCYFNQNAVFCIEP